MALVGCAGSDGFGAGKLAVDMVVGRCSRVKIDLELLAFFMEGTGTFGQCHRYDFRRTGSRETGKSDVVAVFYVSGSLLGRNKWYAHL